MRILDYITDRWVLAVYYRKWAYMFVRHMHRHAQIVCRDSLYSKPLQYSNAFLLPSFIKISFILIDCIL